MSKIVSKPWGREIILSESNLPYTAKILQISGGKRLSLQYHDQKTETLVLVSGKAILLRGPTQNKLEKTEMTPDQGYTIQNMEVHRIEAISDCRIFEASTPEIGITYRLEDDTNRTNETLNHL
ncbi:MAG: cupin [Candidatus Shapirobacteria bacterium]|jgi:mannose-6-phosphate isomerase-like protein (cupin superfamily)